MSNENVTFRVYGAGGFGVNIASQMEADAEKSRLGAAVPDPAYFDTSRANLNGVDRERAYLVPETDGSGKVRAMNAATIAPLINPFLNQFRPTDVNVVVFSASGGSGSVAGPLIAGELLSRGLTVICMVVGSHDNDKECENTLRTIMTLEAQVDRAEAGLVMMFEQNEEGRKRSAVDEIYLHAISCFGVLASRQNAELDRTDVLHAFRFDKSTPVTPRLATLNLARSNKLDPSGQYISMVSIYADPDAEQLRLPIDYRAVGYLPKGLELDQPTFHFAVRVDEVRGITQFYQKHLENYKANATNRVLQERAVSNTVDKNGLVL